MRDLVVHQDERDNMESRYAWNCEYLKGLNNVSYVIWSCIKMRATREMNNAQYVD